MIMIPLSKIKILKQKRNKQLFPIVEFVESIRKKGIINPLILDSDYNLLDGVDRYYAAKYLNLKKFQ